MASNLPPWTRFTRHRLLGGARIGLTRLWQSLKRLGRAAADAWPATLCAAFLLTIALPGIASDQAREALTDYVAAGHGAVSTWAAFLVTLLAGLALSIVLVRCVSLTAQPSAASRYFAWLLFVLPPIVIATACLRLWADGGPVDFPIFAGILLIAAAAIGRTPILRAQIFEAPAQLTTRSGIIACSLIASAVVLFGWLDTAAVPLARQLGPVNIILLFLLALALCLSLLVRAGRLSRIPIILILTALAVVFSYFNLNDNHAIRGVQSRSSLRSFENVFAAWRSKRPDASLYSEYPVILVSAEGGGIRAAYFTGITLARLVDRCPRIANHIFAISGVSGGAVGATVFAAALKADPPDTGSPRCDPMASGVGPYERRVAAVLGDDHLSLLLARATFPDFAQRILPFAINAFDRQRGLELSLESSFERVFHSHLLGEPLSGIVPSDETPAVPFLVLNTTWVETGERVAIAPFIFLGEDFTRLNSLGELDLKFDPLASAAAGTSARFPFVSPAGFIRAGIARYRFVDGGYVDNSGAQTVLEMLRSLESSYGGTYREDNPMKSAYVLLHVGNSPDCEIIEYGAAPTRASRHCGAFRANPYLKGFGELLSPIRTMIAARDARAQLTLRQWEREVTRRQDQGLSYYFSRVQMYDRGTPVPLGWVLSHRATAELHEQLDALGSKGRCEERMDIRNGCELRDLISLLAETRDEQGPDQLPLSVQQKLSTSGASPANDQLAGATD